MGRASAATAATSVELEPGLMSAVLVSKGKWSAWRAGLDMLSRGKVQTKALVSDVLALADWEEGFEKHRSKEGLKIVLKP